MSTLEFPSVFAGLGKARTRAGFLYGGSLDRLQPEPNDWQGLVPGHKQALASPPPGPPRGRACPRREGLRSPLSPESLFWALQRQSRRRALAHSLGAASTSPLPTPVTANSQKAERPDTHAYSRGRPARADAVPAPSRGASAVCPRPFPEPASRLQASSHSPPLVRALARTRGPASARAQ